MSSSLPCSLHDIDKIFPLAEINMGGDGGALRQDDSGDCLPYLYESTVSGACPRTSHRVVSATEVQQSDGLRWLAGLAGLTFSLRRAAPLSLSRATTPDKQTAAATYITAAASSTKFPH